MIAVTCRNGEHFSVDPAAIERVETDPDTVIHLVDGTKYVVAEPFDHLLRTIQAHRALAVVADDPHQLVDALPDDELGAVIEDDRGVATGLHALDGVGVQGEVLTVAAGDSDHGSGPSARSG